MNNSYSCQEVLVHHDGLLNRKYNVPGMAIYLAQEELSLFPGMRTPPFWTEDFETIYVQSGCLNVVVNGEAALVRAKELCFVKPGCVHYLVSENHQSCTFFLGLINESVFYDSKTIRKKYIDPIFHSIHPNFTIYPQSAKHHLKMLVLLGRLHRCLTGQAHAHELLAIALCHEYLHLI